MSYVSGSLRALANLQTEIGAMFDNVPDVSAVQQVPFLQWLYSPINRGQLETTVSGSGKVKTVEVNYMQEIAASDVASDVANPVCSTGELREDSFETYTIDTTENRAVASTFSRTDLVNALQDNPQYVAKIVLQMMYAIEKAVAQKSAEEAVTFVGQWHDDVASATGLTVNGNNQLVVETLQASSSYTPVAQTLQLIQTALEVTGYQGVPYIFGGGTFVNYMRQIVAAGSGANYGLDLGQMASAYGLSAVRDKYVKDALGSENEFLMIQPGALQLLTYTAAEWRNGMPLVTDGANYAQVRLVTPRVGLPVDLIVVDNCGQITYRMIATTKVVGLPTDMFNPENGHNGVTFVNEGLVTNS